jgi:AcrR family transcriptional regulator
MNMSKRPYTQKKRALQQSETRDRIVLATMALHEEVGPRDTTVSAIAERAGVQRLTVYRHFPDDSALFQACTSRWLELNPPPDPEAWSKLEEPMARMRKALELFYVYYRSGERMWSRAHRDLEEVPALEAPMAEYAGFLKAVRDDLLTDWRLSKRAAERLRITLDHALRFQTWRSLAQAGLTDAAMTDLVCGWIHCASSDSATQSD